MPLDFYRTVGGRKFIDFTVPRLAKALEEQSELVEIQVEQQEILIEQNKQIIELLTQMVEK